jgi:putative redox protein
MKVTLNRVNNGVHFQGIGTSNIPINIDGAEKIGGTESGARPMELVLMAIGSCASMDIVSILTKQKQDLKDLKINIEGERDFDKTPAVFKEINVEFVFFGTLDNKKVERAVFLSMEKYCSVSAMLKPSVNISYSYKIVTSD